jgi:hypothetical protein
MMRMTAMVIVAGLALCGGQAMAQQAANGVAGGGIPLFLEPTPPADTGKPRFFARRCRRRAHLARQPSIVVCGSSARSSTTALSSSTGRC